MKYDEFKKRFFNGKTNKKTLIELLKTNSPSFESLNKLIERFQRDHKQFTGLFDQVILGNHFLPKKYSELHLNQQLYSNDSLEDELNWQALGIIKCSEVINKFIILREEFENYLISNRYESARNVLSKIENEICISYWSIENRLILDEFQFGSEKNWDTRNLVVDDKNSLFLKIIGDFFSIKSEANFSFFQYNEYFDAWEKLQSSSKYGLSVKTREYMRFKANYFSLKHYSEYAYIITQENRASIIDRYLIFIKVAQHIVSQKSNEGSFLTDILNVVSDKINDISIRQMMFSNAELQNKFNDYQSQIINIIDQYTNGNYLISKELAQLFILGEKSNVMELYIIYVKSLIECRLEYEPLGDDNSISNQIGKHYYDIFNKSKNTDDAFFALFKLSYIFNNSHIGLHFYGLIKEQLNWETEIDYIYLSRLNSKFFNPALYNSLHTTQTFAGTFLSNLTAQYPLSSTMSLFENFKYNYENKELKNFINIPFIKSKLYQARCLLIKDKYSDTIEIYKDLFRNHVLSIIAEYEAFSNMFTAYLMLQDYQNCLITFVNAFLKNPHLTKMMDNNTLHDIIIKRKFKNVSIDEYLIDLPIFFKINSAAKIRVKQAYELFLKSNNCVKPSELILLKNKFSNDKLIYFLKNVCIPDVMQLSKFMDSTYKVNEERIRICQELALLDNDNFNIYNQEIADITQRNAISKVIGRIDEGKIYVNDEKLKQAFTKSQSKAEVSKLNTALTDRYLTKEYFYRTVELQKFTQHHEYKQSTKIIYANYDNEGNIKLKGNPVFDSFKAMFLEVRDNFVSNNEFGLDAYLSTRIRHGTLPNHIRSVFERFNLVTAQTDGIYANNDYWQEKLKLPQEKNIALQNLLANFSRQVDELSTILKEDWIQYKTEKRTDKPLALFDYTYSTDDQLILFYILKIENYEEFINLCFEELWEKTESSLKIIQEKFNNEVKEKFTSLITDLEQDLEAISNTSSIYELKSDINLSRTEIQILLNNIIKWFKRSESSYDGEYELKMLAETSIQITKNINPIYNFELQTNIDSNIAIKGEYHQHLIDIMRNFLENMIKRSKLGVESLGANFEISEKEELLYFCFENYIAEQISKSELLDKLNFVKSSWNVPDNNVSKEDGTGFPKIKKILHYDLDRKKSAFNFHINKNKLSLLLTFEIAGLKV